MRAGFAERLNKMYLKNKIMLASACTLLFTVPAMAGASLDTLLGGGSLFSNNGKLVFSDFEFTPIINAPSASDISIITLDSGLLFGNPMFADASSGTIDFDISYKVSGVGSGVKIDSVEMKSTGSSTGSGQAGVFKVIENLANLTNVFTSSTTLSSAMTTFDAQDYIHVRDDIFLKPRSGTAGLSDFSQSFGTTGLATAVPSPTAALAGFALLGVIGMRRRRG